MLKFSPLGILLLFQLGCSQTQKNGLLEDFEAAKTTWYVSGDQGGGMTKIESLPADVKGFTGENVFSTGQDHPENMGTLRSPKFIIDKNYINFLITGNSGYNGLDVCGIRLIINDQIVSYAPATRYPLVEWGALEVSDFIGKEAELEIYDNSPKKFLIIDDIHQSDELVMGSDKLTFQATEDYLLFPVYKGGAQYRLRLQKEKEIAEQFVIEMGEGEPDYWAFKDIRAYRGQQLELLSYAVNKVPGFELIRQSDEIPDAATYYTESERPQFHFTSRTGWLNDPNGLVYYNDTWHLMYQHNPYGVIGSLKHWGYAISTDLFHWTELPSSIVPDDLGSNHSGGAVVDFNNSAHLQTGEDKTLVAFWTSAGHFSSPSSKFRQCISYSTDGGSSWKKYEGNPIIENIADKNRDPNVIWHEGSQKWIMSLYLDGNKYAILNSDNLIDWKLQDELEIPATECPDIFQLALDGKNDQKHWIFWGGNGQYVTGDLYGETFIIDSDPHQTHYGAYYAAMTFQNAPDGRVVQSGWIREWPYPHTNFRMQLSIPNEITLRTSPAGYPALYTNPVKELEGLRADSREIKKVVLSAEPYVPDFRADLIDFELEASIVAGAKLYMEVGNEKISYDRDRNTISWGATDVQLLTEGDRQKFRVLVDRASIEIFCNDGEKALFIVAALGDEDKNIQFSSEGGTVAIENLKFHKLSPAWGRGI